MGVGWPVLMFGLPEESTLDSNVYHIASETMNDIYGSCSIDSEDSCISTNQIVFVHVLGYQNNVLD